MLAIAEENMHWPAVQHLQINWARTNREVVRAMDGIDIRTYVRSYMVQHSEMGVNSWSNRVYTGIVLYQATPPSMTLFSFWRCNRTMESRTNCNSVIDLWHNSSRRNQMETYMHGISGWKKSSLSWLGDSFQKCSSWTCFSFKIKMTWFWTAFDFTSAS